jgi:UDP-N-acetylmuramoyl-tripeptide--D-alanyl-D-alanine ligase
MSVLWSGAELVAATGGRPIGGMPNAVLGISIDTRSLAPGDAFFAIKGDTMDGHDFATAAIKAGASVLVVAEGKLPALGRLTAPMIVVPDVLAALEKAGVAARARSRARIIAVTGSAGKTSTKEALRRGLAAVGKVHASAASFNNHWGVPLTLARMPEDCDYAIFEIGMNHEGEIRPLVKLVRPHVAIVTLIAAAHLGHFHSLEDIARAKAEIFEGVEPGGAALINRDDEHFDLLARLARDVAVEKVVGFGENAAADYRLTNLSLHADHSLISALIGGKEIVARIGVPGRHIVQNALAVLGAADIAGADVEKVALALDGLTAEAGRGRRHVLKHPRGPITLIDESYNANPASMKAAIALLEATPVKGGGRRIAVLGDMLELGEHSSRLHSALAELIVPASADIVMLAGPEMKSLAQVLHGDRCVEYRGTAEDLKPLLIETVGPGDVIMVKSSKGIGFSKLVDALIRQFPAGADHANPS